MREYGFSLVFSFVRGRAAYSADSKKMKLLNELGARPIFNERGLLGLARNSDLSSFMIAKAGDFARASSMLELLQNDPEVDEVFIAPPRGVLTHAPAVFSNWSMQINLNGAKGLPQWTGERKVKVAVVDTGVDSAHPQLREVLSKQHSQDQDWSLSQGHGTHVCGIIAALPVDGSQVQGIAYDCVELTSHTGITEPYDPATYYRALVAAGNAQLINLSLGGEHEDLLETRIVNRILAEGKVVVAAAGNHAEVSDNDSYPAALDGVIAVGAVDEFGIPASFSCAGQHLALVAPGTNICSTVPTFAVEDVRSVGCPPVGEMTGTSMAAPIVTGVLARVLSHNPDLDRSALFDLIKNNRGGSWNTAMGYGVVDAYSMLSSL